MRDSIRQISVRSWRASPSVYEGHDDKTRVLMIGSALNAHIVSRDGTTGMIDDGPARERHVKEWLEAHPYEAEWLASVGLSPDNARKLHVEWLDRTELSCESAQSIGLTPGGN